MESLWFFTYKIIVSAKSSFNFFLSNFHAFLFSSCLVALTRASGVMLNRSVRVVTLVLIPTLEKQLSNFLHWARALGFHIWHLLCWGIFFPQFVESFIMKEYWSLSNVFFLHLLFPLLWFTYWFVYPELSLNPQKEFHLIMVHDTFNVLLNFGC